jgi:hypothetical protein
MLFITFHDGLPSFHSTNLFGEFHRSCVAEASITLTLPLSQRQLLRSSKGGSNDRHTSYSFIFFFENLFTMHKKDGTISMHDMTVSDSAFINTFGGI